MLAAKWQLCKSVTGVVGSRVAARPAVVASTFFLLTRGRPTKRLIDVVLNYRSRVTVPIRRIVIIDVLMQVVRVGGELMLVLRRAPIAASFLLAPFSI